MISFRNSGLAKRLAKFVDRLLKIREVPAILTVVLAATAWTATHIAERAVSTPLVAYGIEPTELDDLEACTGSRSLFAASRSINIEYLGESGILGGVQLDVITLGHTRKPEKMLERKLCWLSGGHANPTHTSSEIFDENTPQLTEGVAASRASVTLDQLLPGDRGRIVVPLKSAPFNLDLRLRMAPLDASASTKGRTASAARLTKNGLVTFLVRHEAGLMIAFLVVLVLLAIFLLVSLVRRSR
jgi:hypothetical protein